jgi:hypothetical protein
MGRMYTKHTRQEMEVREDQEANAIYRLRKSLGILPFNSSYT